MKINETKKEHGLAHVEVNIDRAEIDQHKDAALDALVAQVTVKGFRQGKAPRNVAVNHIDPDKLTDKVMNTVLSEAVRLIMTEKAYSLFGRPVLEKIDTKDESGWTVEINFPLMPEVKVDDYKKFLTNTPKKTKTAKKESKKTGNSEESEKLDLIYDTLLKNINIEIAHSVIDEEVNYSLNRLAEQAKSLNLTLEAYLQAVNKTIEQIKTEYHESAEESLKLDLILTAIAKKEGIETPEAELLEFAKVSNVPDSELGRLKSIADRRKTIDFLLKI